MADIFENSPRFKNLSPQAQQIVREKFNKLSPNAQKLVKQKLQLQTTQDNPTFIQQTFNLLEKPRELSRRGLSQLAGAIPQPEPTGRLAQDIAVGTPRIAAETLAETAPEFVSPLAIGTAGVGAAIRTGAKAITPLVQAGGRALAKGVQKTFGVSADSVRKLFKKPLELFTAPTKAKVAKAFSKSELKEGTKVIDDIVSDATTGDAAIIKKAGKFLLRETAKKGSPTATKTLVRGRQALDREIARLENQLDIAKEGRGALQKSIAAKRELRTQFNKALDFIAPKVRQADVLASRQLTVDPFRRIALPGKIGFESPEKIARAIPGFPGVLGAGISAAGALSQQFGRAIQQAPQLGAGGAGAISILLDQLRRRQQ